MSRKPMKDKKYREYSDAHAIAIASGVLMASVERKPARGRTITFSVAKIEEIKREAEAMRADGNWERAGAAALVALWYWCHEQTYGVSPSLTGKEWGLAAIAAGTILKREFDGKAEMLVEFLQWTWKEEGKSTKWRRENGRVVNPLGWRWQFGTKAVVRWRANAGG